MTCKIDRGCVRELLRDPRLDRVTAIALCAIALVSQFSHAQEEAAPAQDSETEYAAPVPDAASTQPGWRFELSLYGWLTTTVRTEVINDDTEQTSEADFGDVLDVLKFAAFTHAEAWNGNWGLFGDLAHIRLEHESEVRLRRTFLSPKLDVDLELRQTIAELGGMRRIGNDRRSLDLLAGARYWKFKTEIDLGPFDRDFDKDWVDAFFGARANFRLAEKWRFTIRGDVGGFGIGSGSELTWNAAALFIYQLNQRTQLGFGYRYLDMEYEADRGAEVDMRMSGPVIGLGFRF